MGKHPSIWDILFVIVSPIVATVISFTTQTSFFNSIFLFFGLPSLYLSFRIPERITPTLLFASASILPIIMIDYICHITGQWIIPYSILDYRLFGYVTFEIILFIVLNIYFVVLFYDYFMFYGKRELIWTYGARLIVGSIIGLFVLFLIFLALFPQVLAIPYFYLTFGLFLILIPAGVGWLHRRELTKKFFITLIYFFYVTFLYEITALKLGWWHFSSPQFIGYITVWQVTFPLEELVFWLTFFSVAIVIYYHQFIQQPTNLPKQSE